MKKYTKLMGLLLSSTCFIGVSLSHAAEPEAPNQLELALRDSSKPLTVVKIDGKGGSHEITLRVADQSIRDPEGRSYNYSMMRVDGARVDRLERGHNDAPELQAGAEIRRLLEAGKYVEGSEMDSRDKAEFDCDESLVKVYYEFKALEDGLLSLKNGEISEKLTDLTKALTRLHLDPNSTISKVNEPLLELIEIVRAAAGKLRGSLQRDLDSILDIVSGGIIGDCETYIEDRIGPVEELKFKDILPTQDDLDMSDSKSNTLFALERVNIKRISKMLLEVRKTFSAVRDETFGRNRHWKIRTFLDNVKKLDAQKLSNPESHSYQINELAVLLDNKETILNGLNKKLESKTNKELTVFCDGIGHINSLLEALMEYFDSASAVAKASVAKDLMALPEGQRKTAITAIGKGKAIADHQDPTSVLARPAIEAAPVHRPAAAKQEHHPAPKAPSSSHAYSGGSPSAHPSSASFGGSSSESYHEPMAASSYSDEHDYDSAPPVPADEYDDEATGTSSSYQASTSHISSSPYAAHQASHPASSVRAEPSKAPSHVGSAQLERWQDNPLSSRLGKAARDLQAKAEKANKDAEHMVYSPAYPAEMDQPFYENKDYLPNLAEQLEGAKTLFASRGETVLGKIEKAKVFIENPGENIHEIIAERERIKEQERRHREFERRLEDDRIERETERLKKEYGNQDEEFSKFSNAKK